MSCPERLRANPSFCIPTTNFGFRRIASLIQRQSFFQLVRCLATPRPARNSIPRVSGGWRSIAAVSCAIPSLRLLLLVHLRDREIQIVFRRVRQLFGIVQRYRTAISVAARLVPFRHFRQQIPGRVCAAGCSDRSRPRARRPPCAVLACDIRCNQPSAYVYPTRPVDRKPEAWHCRQTAV